MTFDTEKIHQFRCNSCGGNLELHNRRTRYVSCPYCGSVSDARDDSFKVLSENTNPAKFKSRSFLKIGLTGTFNKKEYKVIGRICWQNKYKEYWEEGAESGYSDESWTFDEWLLIDENGNYLTIIEDSDGYAISKSFIPKYPKLPKGEITNDFHKNRKKRVTEHGISKVLYFEGESTYLIEAGSTVEFSQYEDNNSSFIAEWRFDNNNNIKEIEFFEEKPISKYELLHVFNIEKAIENIDKVIKKYKTKRRNKRVFFFAGLINFIIGITAAYIAYSYEPFHQTFSVKSALQKSEWKYTDTVWMSVTDVRKDKIKLKFTDGTISIYAKYKVPWDDFKGVYTIFINNNKGDTIYKYSQFNYYYFHYTKTHSAKHTNSYTEEFNINNLSGKLTLGATFKIPQNYAVSDKKIETDIKIYTNGTEYNSWAFIVLGVLLMIIAGFFPNNKKIAALKYM